MNPNIAGIRKDYSLKTLLENEMSKDPMDTFATWWNEAVKSEIEEVNAMTLATCNTEGLPSARIVLLKGFSHDGFTFFTNYRSKKGNDLHENPRAALVFFWKELERQIRIEGTVEKLSDEDSQQYFSTRPVASQIGAWASPQSKVIENRRVIEKNAEGYTEQFKDALIPKPAHWGGYIVNPIKIEFWQGRSSRLHDRILYTHIDGEWKKERLAP